ncbi:MAG TPA: MBL fold metallo-hydrolase [Thermomicrobiales bacterium]|nr:MBL fold metallo-hydrolase [Thermomicrobiales bacterium]
MQDPDGPARSSPERAGARVRVTFIGGPTAVLEVGGLRLLTDPTFSPAGAHESSPGRFLTKTEGPALSADAVGRVDAVLLSHDQHADNLDPAGRAVVAAAPLTLTTPVAAERLGGTARGLENWQRATLPRPDGGSLEVTAVPAQHGPPGCEPITGAVTGFVLGGPGLPAIYVGGDNASLDVVREIRARMGEVELAVLFAGAARTSLFEGAPLTLTAADAAEAARILGARWVVPLHTRGWGHFSEGPDDVRRAFDAAGLADRLRLLEPGETAVL